MTDEIKQHIDDFILKRRQRCVAEFMDENPSVFARPAAGGGWVERLLSGAAIESADRPVIDRALGMLASTARSASHALDTGVILSEAMCLENIPDLEGIEPDADAMVVFAHEDDEDKAEAVAFSRTITIYKALIDKGVLSSDMLHQSMGNALDGLPGSTPLNRSMIETVKRMVSLDLNSALGVS